ncbi:HdeD family acid-resistance protein [Streptomyces sp. NPDC056503]|uniref:HdeD family acid-resistance protein n=1 Tax=Streptomyces sp. NPDC056503 TaxID=3345842 RepID=UPI00369BE184
MASSSGAPPPGGPHHPTARTATAPDPEDQLARLARSWLWLLGGAVATLVPGVLALVWPDVTLHVLGVLIGLYLLVSAGFRFVTVFGRREAGERLPGLLVAVLFVLGGVLCLRHPLQTVGALSLVVGAVWLVSGVVTLYGALSSKNLPHRGLVLAVAVLGIAAGIVVLAMPAESARILTRLLGLWLVLLGLAETALALAWRSALRKAGITDGPDTHTSA